MTKRLQVLLDEEEYGEIQNAARRQRVSLAEWVRQAMRQARSDQSGSLDVKLRAISKASQYEFPTSDIEDMLQEIEVGQGIQ